MAIANQEAKPAYRARKNEFNLLLFENSKRVGFDLPSFPADRIYLQAVSQGSKQ
jgi:hypothetical protein